MEKGSVRIGTRGSKLALIQAESLKKALLKSLPEVTCELIIIKTQGDRIQDSPLSEIGGKGLFIREIEQALLDREIDLAVHSLKDLPTELSEHLEIGAVLKREDPRDALVSKTGKTLDQITSEEVIATSSPRRRTQLLHLDSSFNITDIRGNIDTRLRKMESGVCDALVLAAAGLRRIGYAHRITEYLEPDLMVPAACQGIIGIEISRENEGMRDFLLTVNHEPTFSEARAERAFLGTLQGGCQAPAGCLALMKRDRFEITGLVSDLEGKRVIRRAASGSLQNAVEIAEELAYRILSEGGREILSGIRGPG